MSKSTTSTTTQTPTNPAWVTSTAEDLTNKIKAMGSIDPQSLVAGPNALQLMAAQGAKGLGAYMPLYGEAIDETRRLMKSGAPGVSAASGLDRLQAWMSPYLKDVVDSTLGDFDVDAMRASVADGLALARQGALGGSGAALRQSQTEDARKRARAMTAAALRDQAFNRAAGYSSADADRATQASIAGAQVAAQHAAMQLQAAQQMAGLGSAYDANLRGNIATQFDVGEAFRQMDQQSKRAAIDLLGTQIGMFDGMPYQLFHGQTTNQKMKESDPMNVIRTLGSIALAPVTGGTSLLGLAMGYKPK